MQNKNNTNLHEQQNLNTPQQQQQQQHFVETEMKMKFCLTHETHENQTAYFLSLQTDAWEMNY